MDSRAKAASKTTIQVIGDYYPETLSRKFFVNVPVLMSWVYIAVTKFLSEETVRKFVVLSDSTQLVQTLGDSLPKEYGGQAGELSEVGEALKLE
jgi:phosphatidylinositol transfer protein SFH5